MRPHAQQHWTIGDCGRILRRVTRSSRDLNKSHECDGSDDGTKGEEDGQPELVWSRDGQVSQEVKWESHGYDVGKSLLVKLRTMDDLARHILNTSATMSALVANLIDASARRRSSGKLQPAISASVDGSWSLVE